jgi:hypothetical protein
MKTSITRKFVFFAMIILTLALISCRTAPVYNVTEAPVMASGKVKTSDVKKAILSAGIGLGWQMKEDKPGHIIGTYNESKYSAIVDINYSAGNYSITYRNSTELRYDGSNIHTTYNTWIQNLNRAIQSRLSVI